MAINKLTLSYDHTIPMCCQVSRWLSLFSLSGDLGNTEITLRTFLSYFDDPQVFHDPWVISNGKLKVYSNTSVVDGLIFWKLSLVRTEIVTRVDNDRTCVRYWIRSTFSSDFLFHCCNTVWWCIYLTWNRQHCSNSWIDGFLPDFVFFSERRRASAVCHIWSHFVPANDKNLT